MARWIPGHFSTLGTDGYGRPDTRAALRRHFETDAEHVLVAVLKGLTDTGDAKGEEMADAIAYYGTDLDGLDPRLRDDRRARFVRLSLRSCGPAPISSVASTSTSARTRASHRIDGRASS